MARYKNSVIRFRVVERECVPPRLGTRGTVNRRTSAAQLINSGRVVYSTASLENMKVDPEMVDKRKLVVTVLGDQ